jgi:GNAT superfamily N-acetyltransferase
MLIRRATLLDALAIAHVHVISWRETYRGIVPQSHLDNLNVSKRESLWKEAIDQGHFVFVAESDGNIIGLADGGKFRGKQPDIIGELYAIYVLADHHRKGIGGNLFDSVQRILRQNGLCPFAVWVLAENPAYHFYQTIGVRTCNEKLAAIGGVPLKEILLVYE